MYQKRSHTGSSPEFWEENWEAAQFEEAVRFCAIDPLRPLFEKYLKPGGLMLEGGCGMGHYLTYYAARGHRVVGADFAQGALKTLNSRQEHLRLVGGDVSALPFADESFDLYYSGGVVEHFEGGPEASLREARRVIKSDGTLLISVPYHSPLRRVLHPLYKERWRKVEREKPDTQAFGDGNNFFQYAYRRKEFTKRLSDAGLRVIKTQGYAVIWGLYEVPFMNRGGDSEFPEAADKQNAGEIPARADITAITADQELSLLKRLVVSEDDSFLPGRPFVKLARWAAANMMMYVCVRK